MSSRRGRRLDGCFDVLGRGGHHRMLIRWCSAYIGRHICRRTLCHVREYWSLSLGCQCRQVSLRSGCMPWHLENSMGCCAVEPVHLRPDSSYIGIFVELAILFILIKPFFQSGVGVPEWPPVSDGIRSVMIPILVHMERPQFSGRIGTISTPVLVGI